MSTGKKWWCLAPSLRYVPCVSIRYNFLVNNLHTTGFFIIWLFISVRVFNFSNLYNTTTFLALISSLSLLLSPYLYLLLLFATSVILLFYDNATLLSGNLLEKNCNNWFLNKILLNTISTVVYIFWYNKMAYGQSHWKHCFAPDCWS